MLSRPSSLRRSLLLITAAIVVPLAMLPAVLVALQWDQQRERALADLQEQARALRYALDRELTLDIAVLSTLAASRDLDRGDLQAFYEMAGRTARVRPGSWIILVDSAGQNTLNTAVPLGAPLPNLRRSLARPGTAEWEGRQLPLPALEIFESPLRTGKPAFSGVVYGRISNRPVVATNVAVVRDGRPTHVLGIAYSPDFYVDLLKAQQLTTRQNLAIVIDGSGRVVARNRAPEQFVGLRSPAPFDQGTAPLADEGIGEAVNLEGEPTYFAYSRSRVNDWAAVYGIEKSILLDPARRALWASAAFVLGIIVIASAVSLRLSRRIAVPLTTLAERAESGAHSFDHVQASGIQEIEALKLAMVRAAAARQEQRRSEAERERAARELARAHEQLLETDRQKNEFLATLGHELRNPMGAIGNAASLLSRVDEPDRTKARMYSILLRQTRHVARLLDDLLDVGRVTHGKISLRKQHLELDALARRITEDAAAAVERKRLHLTCEVRRPVTIEGDEVRIVQVLTNLLDNAIKYTPEGGSIELTVSVEGEHAVVRLRDTGIGIPEELLPRIFEPFTQHQQSIERSEGGLGLGLAIVKRLVELHEGTIEVRSGGADRGTEIEVRLPCVPPSPPSSSDQGHAR